MRSIFFLLVFLSSLATHAQHAHRKARDPYPTFGEYERKGWLVSPMITTTLTPLKTNTQRLFTGSDEVYDITFSPAARMGVGIEVGRFYLMDHLRNIHSVEFNLGVKTIRGVERFEAVLDDDTRITPFILKGDGDFTYAYATGNIKLNHSQVLSDHTFLMNSLGINADYMFAGQQRFNNRGLPLTTMGGEKLLIQANYRIGYGFKFTKGMLLMPSVETPILSFITWDDAKSTLQVFNSRYRPILIRMSFILLDKKSSRKCPTKNGRKGGRSESLFGMLDGKAPW